jgi:hypothetical protein
MGYKNPTLQQKIYFAAGNQLATRENQKLAISVDAEPCREWFSPDSGSDGLDGFCFCLRGIGRHMQIPSSGDGKKLFR